MTEEKGKKQYNIEPVELIPEDVQSEEYNMSPIVQNTFNKYPIDEQSVESQKENKEEKK